LRDLDLINSAAKNTRFMFSVSLIIPIFMGCVAWALAAGASPENSIHENFLSLLGLGISFVAIISLPIPYVFRWDWETKYFGAGMLSLSSASIIGIYPVLCIAQYSSLPALIRFAPLFIEGLLITKWCLRFVSLYKKIYSEKKIFDFIYFEELTAVYYSQQADRNVIDKVLKFQQFPDMKYFIFSGLTAFSLLPFSTTISHLIGIPFIHVFLAVFSTPLNMMILGLTTKGWLVFYFYPTKIKREKSKSVYIDISTPAKYLKH